ncbi:hypothetical protein SME46J_13170 [Serratia marcescens]|uniref:Tail fiber assembly protein n=1 Tax=Serratia surfactantfaciens TaxID=2741499 RepID=A0ABS0LWN4_9GAMM|nr:tail fiber assembly protein [Serratia surfactantfaciens]BEM86847.1 hypothetical protein SME46J_13170 [Serratia marcescens]
MVQGEKERRIARVNQVTQTLNNKLLLGMATDEDKAKLRIWIDYLNEVEKISEDAAPEKSCDRNRKIKPSGQRAEQINYYSFPMIQWLYYQK